MFFWNSLAFSMIQQMLAIWSLVPLPFLNPAWTSGSSWFTYCWSPTWEFWAYFASMSASLVAQLVKNLPVMWETWVQSLGWEDPLEKRKATLFSILAWRIPWTWGRRVRHDWATFTFTFFLLHLLRTFWLLGVGRGRLGESWGLGSSQWNWGER